MSFRKLVPETNFSSLNSTSISDFYIEMILSDKFIEEVTVLEKLTDDGTSHYSL